MLKIMFVCHGNICRSPMAEFIFKELIAQQKKQGEFIVASCATSSEEIRNGVGNPIYPPAQAELKRRGIPFSPRRAVQLSGSDYGKYDLFVGMDRYNISNMNRIFKGDPENKVRLLMDYTRRPGDVSDPWYSDRFDVAFDDIYEGCNELLEAILNQNQRARF